MKNYLENMCRQYNENPSEREDMLEFYAKQLIFTGIELDMVKDEINDEIESIKEKREELENLLLKLDKQDEDFMGFDLLCDISDMLEGYMNIVATVEDNIDDPGETEVIQNED